jgi:hypothetical protein
MPGRNRKLLWTALIVAIASVAFGVTWFAVAPEPSLNLTNFRRIKLGMSVSEVNGIFNMRGEMGLCGGGECPWIWRQGDTYACVSFGQRNGKATCGDFVTPDGKQHWLPRKE